VELVPKIGVGIMGIHGNKMRLMYHTGKNSVKAGKTLGNPRENPVNTPNTVGFFLRC